MSSPHVPPYPSQPLSSALSSLSFLNSGITRSTDSFFWENIRNVGDGQKLIYLEAENVSCTSCVWSDGGAYYVPHPYMWKVNGSSASATATAVAPPQWVPLPAFDFTAAPIVMSGTENIQPTEAACEASCAAIATCNVGLWLSGTVRHGECWLSTNEAAVPRKDFCGAHLGQTCASFRRKSFTVPPTPAPSPYYTGVAPALGMRSAVPLGGIGAGSLELRGDGTLHEWIIHNAGPSGAAKIQVYEDAFFAVSVDDHTAVLQTHPRASSLAKGVEGVDAIEYSGAYPVSRLSANISTHMTTDLYGWSTFIPGNMKKTARPAVSFTLAVKNKQHLYSSKASLLFNLPIQLERDQLRSGTVISSSTTADAETCLTQCNNATVGAIDGGCHSWTWTTATKACNLQSDAPLNRYALGVTSGLAGEWITDAASKCLILVRPGSGPMHGNVSMCVSSSIPSGASIEWSANTATHASDLTAAFADSTVKGLGGPPVAGDRLVNGGHGGVSVSAMVPSGKSATLTVTLGWFFPHRDHYNYDPTKPFLPFGNKYAQMYPGGAVEAAFGNVPTAGNAREMALADTITSGAQAWHAPFFGTSATNVSSLPAWLADLLVNSLSHTRDSMWWETCPHCHATNDSRILPAVWGTWRQFEANDCPDIDSIHNDGERSVPYVMMITDGTRSKLAAWAGNQGTNGMLAEQILNTDPDKPQGRVMSDSTSMFIVYVLQLLRWDADETSLKLYWPTVQKAVGWINSTAAVYGVPLKLETTYDILKFPSYQLSTYASAFHILALKAASALATHLGDTDYVAELDALIVRAQTAFDLLQWNTTLGFYNAASDGCTAGVGCTQAVGVFADAFYAQVLAYGVGLGDLLAKPERLDAHLAFVEKANCVHNDVMQPPPYPLVEGCAQGLVIMTGRPVQLTDLQVWEMATFDHASMVIRHASSPTLVSAALDFAAGDGKNYAEVVNDLWNIAGIKFNDGNPSITSHYGYHMTSWHVLLALTGQGADFSDATNASLTFVTPAFPGKTCGFSYPVILPGAVGTISCAQAQFALSFAIAPQPAKGPWRSITTLSVNGIAHPGSAIAIGVGSAVVWAAAA